MKKLSIILATYLLSTNSLIAKEHKCSGMEKISKEFLACTTKNITASANKKSKQIKENTVKKIEEIKRDAKEIINRFKYKMKKETS